jgi:hypothetical protein
MPISTLKRCKRRIIYGGHRPGNQIYFRIPCVCTDVQTGTGESGMQQLIHHDIRDNEYAPLPSCTTHIVAGRAHQRLSLPIRHYQGLPYVFDRTNGQADRAHARTDRKTNGDLPGAWTSPTTAHPVEAAGFRTSKGMKESDRTTSRPHEGTKRCCPEGFRPALWAHLHAGIVGKTLRRGTRGTVMIPGAGGGATVVGCTSGMRGNGFRLCQLTDESLRDGAFPPEYSRATPPEPPTVRITHRWRRGPFTRVQGGFIRQLKPPKDGITAYGHEQRNRSQGDPRYGDYAGDRRRATPRSSRLEINPKTGRARQVGTSGDETCCLLVTARIRSERLRQADRCRSRTDPIPGMQRGPMTYVHKDANSFS